MKTLTTDKKRLRKEKMWNVHSERCGSFTVKGKTFVDAMKQSYMPYGMGKIISIKEITTTA